MPAGETTDSKFDAIVIGAGFGGIYALYRLRQSGLKVQGIEAGDGPGGTWYWNRYPGARVDIESMIYSYSFDDELQQEWHWPEHFSPQEDLEEYANHVIDRFELRRLIQFGTRVTAMRFDEDRAEWDVRTDTGGRYRAKYVVAATGSLNATNLPPFKGIETFEGEWHHTSQWPRAGVDFTGKRVGIIGTGSTGIQAVPVVAEQAEHLYVFQRTANFSLPSRNRPLEADYEADYKTHYPERRQMMMRTATAAVLTGMNMERSVFDVTPEEREQILEAAWESRSGFRFMGSFKDARTNLEANTIVAEFVRNKIRATVRDPGVAELLCPQDHPIGTKRLCLDTGYYETFNRPNVTLVDVRTHPIVEITPHGLQTTARHFDDIDILIFATGFDAMTGSMTRIDIRGVGGGELATAWADGPRTYLGFMVAGFPNLFMVHGPGSPSVLAQMIMGAEWQVDWIAELIRHMDLKGYRTVDTNLECHEWWGQQVDQAADRTLYKMANSWYLGANIEGKKRVFMVYVGGFDAYTDICSDIAARGYEGFELSV
jgi:cation diffusion facilitator CzcD-associated flavoprotein CzcO